MQHELVILYTGFDYPVHKELCETFLTQFIITIVNLVSLSTMTKIAMNFSSADDGNPMIRSKDTVSNGCQGMCRGLKAPICLLHSVFIA